MIIDYHQRIFLTLISLISILSTSISFKLPLPLTQTLTKLKMVGIEKPVVSQFAPAVASLFNNMKTPASILAGAMVPLGLLSELPKKEGVKESKFLTVLRKSYLLITVTSFFSELLVVMWASVAVNKLTETVVAPAESAWHLIQRDYSLPWSAVNAHFVLGVFGFMMMVGTRALFLVRMSGANPYTITSVTSAVVASLSLMFAIVNRGVELGGVDGEGYGKDVISLFRNYIYLLVKQASSKKSFGYLESIALIMFGVTAVSGAWGLFLDLKNKEKKE